MQVAIAVLEAPEAGAAATIRTSHRQGMLDCLSIYDQFVRVPGRQPCTMLVTRGQSTAADHECLEDFSRCRTLLPDADWLPALELRFWKEPAEPLPLELVNVIAAAVMRQRVNDGVPNPIFESVLAKLTHIPAQFRRLSKTKRR